MRRLLLMVMAMVLTTGAIASCSDDGSDAGRDAAAQDGASEQDAPDEGAADGDASEVPDPEEGLPEQPGEVRALVEWSEEFCLGFNAWLAAREASIEGMDLTISPTDYAAQQAMLVEFYEGESAAAGILVGRLERGSVPDIDGGPELVGELRTLFARLVDEAETAAAAAGALDSADSGFEAAGQRINETYQALLTETGDRFIELTETYPALTESEDLGQECAA